MQHLGQDPDRHPIDVLADEFAQRCRSGSCPSVTQYVRDYPDLADEIGELFPAIAAIEQLSRKESSERADSRHQDVFESRVVKRLGDYRIVREIGRGGMGVVYEAVQESLGRTVAVKVLTANAVSLPQHLRRFHREAQAAAGLHHTNIVPIFGVGEEDGLHYFVMQYIDGHGLDRLILDQRQSTTTGSFTTDTIRTASPEEHATTSETHQPLSWRTIAHYGAQVARAVDYAHRQGVLHRDLKPANLLVDNHETVWVTDFGLAKVFGSEELTQSGDVFGTVRYMAPEQFEGEANEKSDIYSLGITLYELATLRPAFQERDARRLMRRITQEGPQRPRNVNPTIPKDLETIIAKASAFAQHHRYATAGELADDLDRFLDGEPIAARPISSAQRLWRWSRRNPALSILSGLLVMLLALTAAVASIGYLRVDEARQGAIELAQREQRAAHKARVANKMAEDETRRAKREFERAEDNLRLALRAFEDVIDRVSGRGFPESLDLEMDEDGPQVITPSLVTGADAELLQSLLTFYTEFAARNGADEKIQLETAKAHHRIGDIRLRLGHFEMALAAYRDALDIYDHAASMTGANQQHLLSIVDVLNQQGVALERTGKTRDAVGAHVRALDRLHEQPPHLAELSAIRFALAETHNYLGSIWSRGSISPTPIAGRGRMGRRGFSGLRDPRRFANPPRTADHYSAAHEILTKLVAEDPSNADYRLALARCHRNYLPIAWRDDRREKAKECLDNSIQILEQLTGDFPDDPRFAFELADVLSTNTTTLQLDESDEHVRQRLQRAVALAHKLNDSSPNQPQYRVLCATALHRYGLALHRNGAVDEAIRQVADSVKHLASLTDQFPTVPLYAISLARMSDDLGSIQRGAGQLRESKETLENAISRLVAAPDMDGEFRPTDRFLGLLHNNLQQTLLVIRDGGRPPFMPGGRMRYNIHPSR